jgi:hypothetical protein
MDQGYLLILSWYILILYVQVENKELWAFNEDEPESSYQSVGGEVSPCPPILMDAPWSDIPMLQGPDSAVHFAAFSTAPPSSIQPHVDTAPVRVSTPNTLANVVRSRSVPLTSAIPAGKGTFICIFFPDSFFLQS